MNVAQFHICDVCRLLDFDTTKKLCGYCGLCDAWICEKDQSNWVRRIKAAAKRRLEPMYGGLPDYVEQMEKEVNAREQQSKPDPDVPSNSGAGPHS